MDKANAIMKNSNVGFSGAIHAALLEAAGWVLLAIGSLLFLAGFIYGIFAGVSTVLSLILLVVAVVIFVMRYVRHGEVNWVVPSILVGLAVLVYFFQPFALSMSDLHLMIRGPTP